MQTPPKTPPKTTLALDAYLADLQADKAIRQDAPQARQAVLQAIKAQADLYAQTKGYKIRLLLMSLDTLE